MKNNLSIYFSQSHLILFIKEYLYCGNIFTSYYKPKQKNFKINIQTLSIILFFFNYKYKKKQSVHFISKQKPSLVLTQLHYSIFHFTVVI